jgi:transcriptional regulator with XRE-family HTH domain
MTTQGERLEKIRRELKLTQQQFADKLGISKGTISKVEKNKGSFSSEILCKLLVDFNVNLNYLLGGFSPMFLNENHKKSDEQLFREFQEFMKKNRKE